MHPSGAFFAYSGVFHGIGVSLFFGDLSTYSGVPHSIDVLLFFGDLFIPLVRFILVFPSGIGILMFLGNLCTPLVRFSNILACLMVLETTVFR